MLRTLNGGEIRFIPWTRCRLEFCGRKNARSEDFYRIGKVSGNLIGIRARKSLFVKIRGLLWWIFGSLRIRRNSVRIFLPSDLYMCDGTDICRGIALGSVRSFSISAGTCEFAVLKKNIRAHRVRIAACNTASGWCSIGNDAVSRRRIVTNTKKYLKIIHRFYPFIR